MKTTMLLGVMMAMLAGVPTRAHAGAQTVSLAPAEAALLPDDESGSTRVAMRFDMAGLPAGESRTVSRANLEWTVAGLDAESECNIYASAIDAAWTAQGAGSGQTEITTDGDLAVWAVEPRDYAVRGGYVKLRLGDAVRAWADGSADNFGLLITFTDIDREALGEVLASARLNVRVAVDQ